MEKVEYTHRWMRNKYTRDCDMDGYEIDGSGDRFGKTGAWVLPVYLQPGIDMDRLIAYKKAVQVGFYNEGL